MPTVSGIVTATGTEASGRTILLDIMRELAAPIDSDDSKTLALAADAFRAAVRIMNRKGLWPWEILDEDITITANQRLYALSGAVKKPLAMHYTDGSGGVRDQRLGYRPYDQFMEFCDQNVAGQAFIYTIPNFFETGQVLLFPTPSANDTARITYYRVTPTPRMEQEPVEIPESAIEVYKSIAWAEFLKRLPSEQRPFPIAVAIQESRIAFRELSAHVNSPSDRIREVW